MSNNQTLGRVSIHTKTSKYFLAHRVRAPGGMGFLRGSVITPAAKLSRQHSPRPINGNPVQVLATPPARLGPRQTPRSITNASTTIPPIKSSGPNSLRMINNVDTIYAQHEARTWNEYRSQIYHLGGHSLLEDVTIPTNILRYANIAEEWTQNVDCYKEGLRDPDPRIRHIHIDRLLCTMSAEQVIMRQVGRESYMGRLIDTLEDGSVFEGSYGLCEHFDSTPQYDRDYRKSHPINSGQHTTATSRRHFQVRKKRLSIRDPMTEELRTSIGPKKSL
jgi:hypothetical protein